MTEENTFETPYAIIGPGEEETFILKLPCPECGGVIPVSFAEFMRCARNDNRPRPVCECGCVAVIDHEKRFNPETGELEEV